MEDFGFDIFGGGFCGFAVGFGHGFRVAESHAGGSAEDAADGPSAVVVGEKDFAGALFFRAIVPAAEEGKMIAEESKVAGFRGLLFERGDGMVSAFFRRIGG